MMFNKQAKSGKLVSSASVAEKEYLHVTECNQALSILYTKINSNWIRNTNLRLLREKLHDNKLDNNIFVMTSKYREQMQNQTNET